MHSFLYLTAFWTFTHVHDGTQQNKNRKFETHLTNEWNSEGNKMQDKRKWRGNKSSGQRQKRKMKETQGATSDGIPFTVGFLLYHQRGATSWQIYTDQPQHLNLCQVNNIDHLVTILGRDKLNRRWSWRIGSSRKGQGQIVIAGQLSLIIFKTTSLRVLSVVPTKEIQVVQFVSKWQGRRHSRLIDTHSERRLVCLVWSHVW